MDSVREKNSIYVIDDFHPFPEALREHALLQEYEDWHAPDGQVYKRICVTEPPGELQILEGLIGPVEMLGMAYRLNFNGEEPNTAIHSDVGWGTHALVHYISEGLSGTAFWKHKETGCTKLGPDDDWLYEKVSQDWGDESKWERVRYVTMKFNRALIYDSTLFHSRYPFRAFGKGPMDGRLIVIAFFNPRNKL